MKECMILEDDMKKIYKQIGQNVKRLRAENGSISQLALALAIGHKAVGTVSMAEICTNNKHFNIEHIIKIANVLECEISDFFKGINYK